MPNWYCSFTGGPESRAVLNELQEEIGVYDYVMNCRAECPILKRGSVHACKN